MRPLNAVAKSTVLKRQPLNFCQIVSILHTNAILMYKVTCEINLKNYTEYLVYDFRKVIFVTRFAEKSANRCFGGLIDTVAGRTKPTGLSLAARVPRVKWKCRKFKMNRWIQILYSAIILDVSADPRPAQAGTSDALPAKLYPGDSD
jgi:hypothetical protein